MNRTLPHHFRDSIGDGRRSRGQLYNLLVYHLRDRQWEGYPDFQFDAQPPPDSPSSILIIVLSSIGDVTTALPTIHSVADRWPDADVEFLCEQECGTAVTGHPELSDCHQFPASRWIDWLYDNQSDRVRDGIRERVTKLRKRSFDYVINLHWSPFAALLTDFLRPDVTNGLVINDRLRPVIRGNPIRQLKYLNMTRENSVPIPVNAASYKRLSADVADGDTVFYARREHDEYQRILDRFQSEAGKARYHVLINTGSRMEGRRWPPQHCTDVLQQLNDALDVEFGLVGGPSDRERLETIEASLGGEVTTVPWYRMTNRLIEDVYLSDCADLTLSTDSGPLHLISVRGNPVLDVAGDMWVGPWTHRSLVVRDRDGDIGSIPSNRILTGSQHLLEGQPLPETDGETEWFRSPWPVSDYWFRHRPLDTFGETRFKSWLSGMLSLKLWSLEARSRGWNGLGLSSDRFIELVERLPFEPGTSLSVSELTLTGRNHLSNSIVERSSEILTDWGF